MPKQQSAHSMRLIVWLLPLPFSHPFSPPILQLFWLHQDREQKISISSSSLESQLTGKCWRGRSFKTLQAFTVQKLCIIGERICCSSIFVVCLFRWWIKARTTTNVFLMAYFTLNVQNSVTLAVICAGTCVSWLPHVLVECLLCTYSRIIWDVI